jgi:hypothetical protein
MPNFSLKYFSLLCFILVASTIFVPFATAVTQTLDVTATVGASPSDYLAELTEPSLVGSPITHETTMTYQIRYQAKLHDAEPVTVQASWSQGTVAGDSLPSVAIIDYVPNSASFGYNYAPAVVDPINRTISWTIPALPPFSMQTVSFQLRTVPNYSGTLPVQFSVSGRVVGSETQTADSTLTKTYLSVLPTSAIRPTAKAEPLPTIAPTKMPDSPTTITSLAINSLTTTAVELAIQLSKPAMITVQYGTKLSSLTSSLTSLLQGTSQRITLTNLEKNTVYYFRLTATGEDGKKITTNLYTFTTASAEQAEVIQPNTLVINAGGIVLFHPGSALTKAEQSINVPESLPFSVQFRVSDPNGIKTMHLFLRNDMVLGLATIPLLASGSNDVLAQQIGPGLFAGRLVGASTGKYMLYATVTDVSGNIIEYRLLPVSITPTFSIREAGTERPIERAKVLLSFYNPEIRIYESLNQSTLGLSSPQYADDTGIVPVVLPNNRYRAEINALGYGSKTVLFTIGSHNDETYPTVYLDKHPFSLTTLIQIITAGTIDTAKAIVQNASHLARTFRFFTLAGTLIVACFVILTFMAFLARIKLPLRHLVTYFKHHAAVDKKHAGILYGLVNDGLHPIHAASVLLTDAQTGKVLTRATTDTHGAFHFRLPPNHEYAVHVDKIGYALVKKNISDEDEQLVFSLTNHEHIVLHEFLTHFVGWIINFLFESLLMLSLLLEILLVFGRGWTEAGPFLFITLANIGLWAYYSYHNKHA